MHSILLASVLSLAVSAPFPAGQDGFAATLSVPASTAVRAGEKVRVELQVEVKADARIPATLLRGNRLVARTVEEGDEAGAEEAAAPADETVRVAAGTRIHRTLEVAIDGEPGPARQVRIAWPGVASTTTMVRVVEDLRDVPLEELDLEQTRVLLATSHGDMELSFFPDKAPGHVKNFIALAQKGFYDGTRFHRVIRGFMAQGGCPNTKEGDPRTWGQGGPGHTVPAEFNDTLHERGVLSMARSQDPDSAGSQFFLVHARAPHLDNEYTAFGRIVSGLDVLDRICEVPVGPGGDGRRSRPLEDVFLHRALVVGVRK